MKVSKIKKTKDKKRNWFWVRLTESKQNTQVCNSSKCYWYRRYYMKVLRYEISLRLLKNISRVRAGNERNIFEYEKRNFLSSNGHVMFYSLYKHQWNTSLLRSRSWGVAWKCGRDLSCSHSNARWSFHVWGYVIFTWKDIMFSPGFSLVRLL